MSDEPKPLREHVDDLKRRLVLEAIKACSGNISQAAKRLGYKRESLYRLMRQLGIPSEAKRVMEQREAEAARMLREMEAKG